MGGSRLEGVWLSGLTVQVSFLRPTWWRETTDTCPPHTHHKQGNKCRSWGNSSKYPELRDSGCCQSSGSRALTVGSESPCKWSKLTYVMCSEQQLPLRKHANVLCCCCSWTFSKGEARHLEKAGRKKQRGWLSSCSAVEVIRVKSGHPVRLSHTDEPRRIRRWQIIASFDATFESGMVKGWAGRNPMFLLVIQWKGSDLVDRALSFLCPMRKKIWR